MSLRTIYSGGIDVKLAEARTSGNDSILTTNLTNITTQMTAAANSGKKNFVVNIGVTYQPADLRLKGDLWEAYKSGIQAALAAQDIMMNEVAVSLNTSDQLNTSIDLTFSF